MMSIETLSSARPGSIVGGSVVGWRSVCSTAAVATGLAAAGAGAGAPAWAAGEAAAGAGGGAGELVVQPATNKPISSRLRPWPAMRVPVFIATHLQFFRASTWVGRRYRV